MAIADGRSPTVLVTDADRGSAIAIIRSLGRRGHRVLAADAARDSLGFHSRFMDRAVVYSSPEQDPDAFCRDLLQVVRDERVDLIIPVTDFTVQPLAARRRVFESWTRLALPPDDALRVVNDKHETIELARRLGVPTPETRRVETVREALACSADLGWPVVLKPQASHLMRDGHGIESFQVTYAASAADLQEKMRRFEGRCHVLLQRFFPGAGHGVELLLWEGRPLAAFQHRRLREIPLTGGASSYRESVPLDPRLYRDTVRLLQELRWSGLAMVEFKVGAGGHQLMEVNGRVWGSLPLAVTAGIDFPALLVQLYLRGAASIQPRLDGDYELGVRSRDLQRDLLWIGAVLARRQRYAFLPIPERWRAVRALLGLFNPQRRLDLLAWDDPLPGLFELPRIGAKLWHKGRQAKGAA
jgi:predicted ATP-grasp superfamily ATP-dependent carboligase